MNYNSREIIITRGNLFITRVNDILLVGEKYWQYMAPEGFRKYAIGIKQSLNQTLWHKFPYQAVTRKEVFPSVPLTI